MTGPYTHTFDFAPGDLVDVPHLCIDGAKVLYCAVGRSLEVRYLIQWPTMSTPHETMINAADLVLHVDVEAD